MYIEMGDVYTKSEAKLKYLIYLFILRFAWCKCSGRSREVGVGVWKRQRQVLHTFKIQKYIAMNDAKRGHLNIEIKTNAEIPHPIGENVAKRRDNII